MTNQKCKKGLHVLDEVGVQVRQGRQRCLGCILKRRRVALGKRTPEQQKNSQLKQKFGITLEDYNRMYVDQKGVCAVCGGNGQRKLAVDHNHQTGKVRALLCVNCNVALGLMKESPELLIKLISYLQEHNF